MRVTVWGRGHAEAPLRKRRELSPASRPVPRLPDLPGGIMRAALMAIAAVLVGLAVASIPLLPMLFCGGAE